MEHYEKLLQTVPDEAEWKRILKLLEEEKKKTHFRRPTGTRETAGIGQIANTGPAIPSSVLGALQFVS